MIGHNASIKRACLAALLVATVGKTMCVGTWHVKRISPSLGQGTWVVEGKIGVLSDETTPILVFNSDSSGGVITLAVSGNYQLAEDLTSTVSITAGQVSLNMNQHKITVSNSNATAIIITGTAQVSVTNGYVQGGGASGTGSGVQIGAGVANVTLKDLIITGCGVGVSLLGTNSTTSSVNGCTFNHLQFVSTGTGFYGSYAVDNLVKRCTALYSVSYGFSLFNSQANCFYDCAALKTGTDAGGTGTTAGFTSNGGTSNFFQRCIAKQTKSSSTTFGDKACGFLLTGTEFKTKIIDCTVNETDVVSSPTAVTFGVNLAPVLQPTSDLLSTITLWINQAGEAWATAWSPNNNYLAVSYRAGIAVKVYGFDGTNLTLITSITPAAQAAGLSWSPNGQYLAVGETVANNVTVYSFNGQILTNITSSSGGTGGKTLSVAWSPNGKYIAYTDAGTVATGSVGILSFDGSTLSLISSQSFSFPAGAAPYVSWAPDGSALVFVVDNITVPITVFPVNSDGKMGTLVQLTTNISWNGVAWSPNGKYFAAVGDSSVGLYVYRWLPSDANPIALAAPSVSPGSTSNALAWSPDGNYIVVGGLSGSNYAVPLYQFSGTSLSYIKTATQTLNGVIRNLSWSSDGRYISASSSPTLASQFMVITAMYGPLNCLIDNCRVGDTLASNMNMGRGLVQGGTNVCTRTISCNNGINYSYGIPNIYHGRFEISRNAVQPFDNVSLPETV